MAQINMYLTGSKTYLKCKIIDHLIGKYILYLLGKYFTHSFVFSSISRRLNISGFIASNAQL